MIYLSDTDACNAGKKFLSDGGLTCDLLLLGIRSLHDQGRSGDE